ncbi:hypothetical protein BU25DRAFT_494925 [Macroventuria anomochaeta]|uniref:Uncharacterized protein n=1 Tax=Macroventuria anomochaeta TaxID=301207 RepID=A0ACB6RL57_9PLEO|nr:uncharacterized protein BU25DRAFT_494925 [Macroventuria anomochaeta]KAF2622606.1 hypothetical protein BU25DRAFT_494925 [Macroventuria anomochaeta]
MLVSNSIWAAYGIKTAPEESFEMRSLPRLTKRTSTPQPSLIVDTSSAPSPSTTPTSPSTSNENTIQATTTFTPAVPVAPSAPSPPPAASRLSPAAIVGLCIGIGVVVLIAYGVLEACVLRKRRRERALRRAVEEVEWGSVRSVESREDVVMERKGDVVVGEEEVWEVEDDMGGRKGMSLPRRVW